MIKVLNGGLITSTAAENTVVPVEASESDGGYSKAGRHEFMFQLISGSVQMSRGTGISPPGYTSDTISTAGDRWIMTVAPELTDGGIRNMRIKGVGTVRITW